MERHPFHIRWLRCAQELQVGVVQIVPIHLCSRIEDQGLVILETRQPILDAGNPEAASSAEEALLPLVQFLQDRHTGPQFLTVLPQQFF